MAVVVLEYDKQRNLRWGHMAMNMLFAAAHL